MKSQNAKKKKNGSAWEVVDAYVSKKQQKTDPQGSWTGKPRDKDEIPVQDVDDL